MTLKSPFPWFGGKSRVAQPVWAALGAIDNYVEPFFGSGAMLLLRPEVRGIETVNDKDGFVANFWRAVKHDPEQVAIHADNPVNECDLHARHLWMLGQSEPMTDRLCGDPDYFDPKVAGWWVWGQCCWIGSGWCAGEGPWISDNGVMVKRGDAGRGVNRTRPHLGNAGRGVNRKRPHLGDAGRGVNRQLPHLGDAGRGVNRQLPHLGNAGRCQERLDHLAEYMQGLADRLRDVRVCCGDWRRVCTNAVMRMRTRTVGATGVFLDPPYSAEASRDERCYRIDSPTVAKDAFAWAVEAGKSDKLRIVFAGYDGEHEFPSSWRKMRWKANGGMGNQGNGQGKTNRGRETLWFSPACMPIDLFEDQ